MRVGLLFKGDCCKGEGEGKREEGCSLGNELSRAEEEGLMDDYQKQSRWRLPLASWQPRWQEGALQLAMRSFNLMQVCHVLMTCVLSNPALLLVQPAGG